MEDSFGPFVIKCGVVRIIYMHRNCSLSIVFVASSSNKISAVELCFGALSPIYMHLHILFFDKY